jgi:hypothetical protein
MHQPDRFRHYRLFDLTIASSIELPELAAEEASGSADLVIELGDGDAGYLLDIPGVALYRIDQGRRITVSAEEGADPRDVRLFLLGSAMGIALHQRGMLPLHANAVVIGGAAVAFTGASGMGKSTLAAWFHDRGYRLLADDVVVIGLGASGPLAYPGLPRLRLRRDALIASGRRTEDHLPSYRPDPGIEHKFDVTIDARALGTGPVPLAALFLLDRGEVFRSVPLSGMEAVEALSANTYRGQFVPVLGNPARHFETCLEIAKAVPVFHLVRTFDKIRFEAEAARILELCDAVQRPGG